ncbi:MAG: hypothetical protein NZ602_08345 [Thermoguttaceae bacterium]|nr:hypothetical protein [Thermoguttaceae bacterium]MDW8039332.1 hypothetical protein [Thermoguttaceae bacterium]
MQAETFIQDQASQLRQWVRQQAGCEAVSGNRGPRLVVVLGGHPGVGATTLAMNLTAALSAAGLRSVLLDLDLGRADASRWCRLQSRETLADVICCGRTLLDVLQTGPDGFSVLPGIGPDQPVLADPRYICQRILDGLRTLSGWAEIVVVDLGSQLAVWTRALWRSGDCRLVVTSSAQNILMDTYAMLKLLSTQLGLLPVHVVINRAATETEAQEVYERLARTCLRFLALPVSRAGFVPIDPRLAQAPENPSGEVSWRLAGESAAQLSHIAHYVAQLLGNRHPMTAAFRCVAATPPTEAGPASGSKPVGLRSEPAWAQASSAPLQWHVQPGDWVGKVGFPVTVSPSLDDPVGENSKKL